MSEPHFRILYFFLAVRTSFGIQETLHISRRRRCKWEAQPDPQARSDLLTEDLCACAPSSVASLAATRSAPTPLASHGTHLERPAVWRSSPRRPSASPSSRWDALNPQIVPQNNVYILNVSLHSTDGIGRQQGVPWMAPHTRRRRCEKAALQGRPRRHAAHAVRDQASRSTLDAVSEVKYQHQFYNQNAACDHRFLLIFSRREVSFKAGTERAFTGRTVDGSPHDEKRKGVYVGAVGGLPLFSSDQKYNSG